MLRAAFTTLGCKVNQYETQKILDSYEDAGFEIVPFQSVADVYVVNTCSVTSIAESKSRYTIRRALKQNPLAKMVVTGCAAQMAINKNEEIDGADVLVPNPEKLDSLKYLLEAFPEFKKQLEESKKQTGFIPAVNRSRANIKIQDGCSVYCSYCSIPYTRPGMKSVPYQEVLAEVNRMVKVGYKEIILTGVLIGSYGPDTGSNGPDFESLIELLHEVEGLKRIRISSIETNQVSDRLIDIMKLKDTKVVPHLHIPLQCGDSGVLKDMNRPYTKEYYIDLCKRLYEEIPQFSLSTDIMVGFPTETEERFQSTVEVCEAVNYLKAHLFRFSPRFGTPADEWGDRVNPEEKQRRSKVLSEITNRTAQAHIDKFLGKTMRVLVEMKEGKNGLLKGLTDNYLDVEFAGPKSLLGNIAYVTLENRNNLSITGSLSHYEGEGNELPASRLIPLLK